MRSFASRILRLRPIVLAFGALLVCAAGALAADTYTLRQSYAVGDRWSFDVTSTMKLKGQITANGQPFQPIEQDVASHRKGTIEVLSIDGGIPASLRVIYDNDCSNSGKMNGQDLPPFPLTGKTVTIRKENGNVTNDLQEQPDQMTQQELARMLDPDTSIYPKDPVAVNQEWEGDPALFAKQFQLGPDDKAFMKCKLLAVKEENGQPVADISIVGNVVKHEPGALPIESKVMLGGVMRLDLKTGHPLTVDMLGKMSMTGAAQVPGPKGEAINAAADASGEMQIHQLSRSLNNAEPIHGPPGGFDDNLPHPMPGPMPAPVADAPFSGSFKSDQLALELNTAAGGKVTGTLTVGGKPCPVVAQADGANLAGTFESDGNKFNFTATTSGNTLVLKSDGSTYTLQKAAANPLAQPAPRNPLGQ